MCDILSVSSFKSKYTCWRKFQRGDISMGHFQIRLFNLCFKNWWILPQRGGYLIDLDNLESLRRVSKAVLLDFHIDRWKDTCLGRGIKACVSIERSFNGKKEETGIKNSRRHLSYSDLWRQWDFYYWHREWKYLQMQSGILSSDLWIRDRFLWWIHW